MSLLSVLARRSTHNWHRYFVTRSHSTKQLAARPNYPTMLHGRPTRHNWSSDLQCSVRGVCRCGYWLVAIDWPRRHAWHCRPHVSTGWKILPVLSRSLVRYNRLSEHDRPSTSIALPPVTVAACPPRLHAYRRLTLLSSNSLSVWVVLHAGIAA